MTASRYGMKIFCGFRLYRWPLRFFADIFISRCRFQVMRLRCIACIYADADADVAEG